MPIIFEGELNKILKSSLDFKSSYILFGDDVYLKTFYANKIAEKSFDGDPFFNFQKFSGDISVSDVCCAIEQMPMMSDRKCVVLDDFDYEHCLKSDFDFFCEKLEDIPDYCTVILKFETIECDHKRNAKFKKLLSSCEKGGGAGVLLDHRKPAELIKMLCDGAKKRGCELDRQAAEYAIQNIGDDILTLKNEFDKVCFYKKSGKIEKEDIDNVCSFSVEASVYDYAGCIISGNVSKALSKLNDLFYLKIEPIIIIYTAAASFTDMFRLYCAQKENKSREDVKKDFDYKNKGFLVDRASANLRNFSKSKLDKCLKEILKAEVLLKSSSVEPKTILEELTVKLIYIAKTGEKVVKD